MQYIKAKPIAKAKEVRDDGSIIEISVWVLLMPVLPRKHPYKYRLYYGRDGVCFVRYDNGRGKADHKHLGSTEYPYFFTTLDALLDDFETDVTNWR